MLRLPRHLLATTALIGALGGLGTAHAGPNCSPDMMGPGDSPRAERMLQRMEKRQAEHQEQLKKVLKLTPEQTPVWQDYIQATKRPDRPKPNAMDWTKLTTPERLDRMQAWQQEHQKHIQQRVEATRKLYAALNPEQQKVFDAQSMPRMGRDGMPMTRP